MITLKRRFLIAVCPGLLAFHGMVTYAVDLPQTIRVGKLNGSSYDVYTLTLEDYLRGVAHHEMSYLRNIEAYKCQTVAARGYAASNMGKHNGEGFDVCNQTCCQRWEPDYDPLTDQSISATTGEVIIYDNPNDPYCGTGATYYNQIITAWYYGGDTCRGYTRNVEDVWGGCRPWARSVNCPCGHSDTGWYGHGVGMHQQGAYQMATGGSDYEQILTHYYTDVRIEGSGSVCGCPCVP